MTAKYIIEKNIITLQQTLHKKNNLSLCLIHELIGKVILAVEIGALSWAEAEPHLDILLNMHNKLKE